MPTRTSISTALACAAVIGAGVLAALTAPASADKRQVTIRLANGQVITVTVDVPPGTPLSEIEIPGLLGPARRRSSSRAGRARAGEPAPAPGAGQEQAKGGDDKSPARSPRTARPATRRRNGGRPDGAEIGRPSTGG